VRRASERVFRTAPAVSIALKKLQEEIGSPLFKRGERNMNELTAAGSLLYSYATKILTLRREAVAGLRDLTQCRVGVVKIGANESTSLYLLPKLTHAFQEVLPGLKIEATCDNSETIITALKDRRLDLALVAWSTDDSSLTKHLLMRDEIVLIANPGHRLATLPKVDIRDVREEVLIAEGSKSSLQEEVTRSFHHSGAQFEAGVTNVSIEAIKRMVTEGVGVGFVPSMCVHDEESRGELAIIRVEGISRQRELWLVQRSNESLSTAAEAFVKVSLRLTREWAKDITHKIESDDSLTSSRNPSPKRLPSPIRSYC
jgi:DNA-binding transcriptional LysR family regulator